VTTDEIIGDKSATTDYFLIINKKIELGESVAGRVAYGVFIEGVVVFASPLGVDVFCTGFYSTWVVQYVYDFRHINLRYSFRIR